MGSREEQMHFFMRVLNLDQEAAVLLYRAEHLQERGQFQQAHAYFQEVLTARPQSVEAVVGARMTLKMLNNNGQHGVTGLGDGCATNSWAQVPRVAEPTPAQSTATALNPTFTWSSLPACIKVRIVSAICDWEVSAALCCVHMELRPIVATAQSQCLQDWEGEARLELLWNLPSFVDRGDRKAIYALLELLQYVPEDDNESEEEARSDPETDWSFWGGGRHHQRTAVITCHAQRVLNELVESGRAMSHPFFPTPKIDHIWRELPAWRDAGIWRELSALSDGGIMGELPAWSDAGLTLRKVAGRTLGNLIDYSETDAISTLRECLHDTRLAVRLASIDALQEFMAEESYAHEASKDVLNSVLARFIVDKSNYWRDSNGPGPRERYELIQLLGMGLAMRGDGDVIALLIHHMLDPAPAVRGAAAFALQSLLTDSARLRIAAATAKTCEIRGDFPPSLVFQPVPVFEYAQVAVSERYAAFMVRRHHTVCTALAALESVEEESVEEHT